MVNREDIISVPILETERVNAEQYAIELAQQDRDYRVKPMKGHSHDYYGYLAQSAVDGVLEDKGVAFESQKAKPTPDSFDLKIADETYDVKATHRNNYDIDKWWNYQKFLIFEHQIERGIIQKKDSLIFCIVDDPKSYVYIFGALSVNDFLKFAKKVGPKTNPNLKWDNREISVTALRPFWKYIYHVK